MLILRFENDFAFCPVHVGVVFPEPRHPEDYVVLSQGGLEELHCFELVEIDNRDWFGGVSEFAQFDGTFDGTTIDDTER